MQKTAHSRINSSSVALLLKVWLVFIPASKTIAAKNLLGRAIGKAKFPANECECQSQQLRSPYGCFWLFFFSDHCSLGTFHFILPSPVFTTYFAEATKVKKAATGRPV